MEENLTYSPIRSYPSYAAYASVVKKSPAFHAVRLKPRGGNQVYGSVFLKNDSGMVYRQRTRSERLRNVLPKR